MEPDFTVAIDSFANWEQYSRFRDGLLRQVQWRQIPIERPYSPFVVEFWFEQQASGEIWRLLAPNDSFPGCWLKIADRPHQLGQNQLYPDIPNQRGTFESWQDYVDFRNWLIFSPQWELTTNCLKFRHPGTGATWELRCPDAPFTGSWEKLDDSPRVWPTQ